MPVSAPKPTALNLEDFRRLGVRPNEHRLTIIRQAACRSARSLAEQQLESPSAQAALQLSRVATSAYRLLDPRKRSDSTQRAHVGRILPNALAWASPTHFHNAVTAGRADVPFQSDRLDDTELLELLELRTADDESDDWARTLRDDDLLRRTPLARQIHRLRRQVHRPAVLLTLIVLLLTTAAALASWRPDQDRLKWQLASRQSAATSTERAPAAAVESSERKSEPSPRQIQPEANSGSSLSEPDELTAHAPDRASSESHPPEQLAGPSEELAGSPEELAGSPEELAGPPEELAGLPEELVGPLNTALALNEEIEVSSKGGEMSADDSPIDHDSRIDAESVALADSSSQESPYLPDPLAEFSDPSEPVAESSADDQAAEMQAGAQGQFAGSDEEQRLYPVPPADVEAQARASIVAALPALSHRLSANSVATSIRRLSRLRSTFAEGSPNHWAAELMLIELAWLESAPNDVCSRLRSLANVYEIDRDRYLVSTLEASERYVASESSRKHLCRAGLILAERTLVAESPEECSKLLALVKRLAAVTGDAETDAHLRQFSEAMEQMNRLAGSSDTGITGRYLCLMLRRWDEGLPLLARTSDLRLASVAKQELNAEAPTADSHVELADRWLSLAERFEGRPADSMRLRAVEHFSLALRDLSELQRLKLEKRVAEITSKLPFFALENRTFHGAPHLDIETPAVPNTPQGEVAPRRRADAELLMLGMGLTGRVSFDEERPGIRVNYKLGSTITREAVEEIGQSVGQQLTAVTIQLDGQFELPEASQLVVVAADAAQEIWLDGQRVTIDRGSGRASVRLPSGQHTIRWRLRPLENPAAFLALLHQSGVAVPVSYPRTERDAAESAINFVPAR